MKKKLNAKFMLIAAIAIVATAAMCYGAVLQHAVGTDF